MLLATHERYLGITAGFCAIRPVSKEDGKWCGRGNGFGRDDLTVGSHLKAFFWVIGPMLGFFPTVYVKQNSYITCMDEKPSMKLTRCCIFIFWGLVQDDSSDLQVFLLGRSTFPRHGVEGSYSSKEVNMQHEDSKIDYTCMYMNRKYIAVIRHAVVCR